MSLMLTLSTHHPLPFFLNLTGKIKKRKKIACLVVEENLVFSVPFNLVPRESYNLWLFEALRVDLVWIWGRIEVVLQLHGLSECCLYR